MQSRMGTPGAILPSFLQPPRRTQHNIAYPHFARTWLVFPFLAPQIGDHRRQLAAQHLGMCRWAECEGPMSQGITLIRLKGIAYTVFLLKVQSLFESDSSPQKQVSYALLCSPIMQTIEENFEGDATSGDATPEDDVMGDVPSPSANPRANPAQSGVRSMYRPHSWARKAELPVSTHSNALFMRCDE
jgi:hypothetical protein